MIKFGFGTPSLEYLFVLYFTDALDVFLYWFWWCICGLRCMWQGLALVLQCKGLPVSYQELGAPAQRYRVTAIVIVIVIDFLDVNVQHASTLKALNVITHRRHRRHPRQYTIALATEETHLGIPGEDGLTMHKRWCQKPDEMRQSAPTTVSMVTWVTVASEIHSRAKFFCRQRTVHHITLSIDGSWCFVELRLHKSMFWNAHTACARVSVTNLKSYLLEVHATFKTNLIKHGMKHKRTHENKAMHSNLKEDYIVSEQTGATTHFHHACSATRPTDQS